MEWIQAHLVAGTPPWLMLAATFAAALVVPLGAEVALAAIAGLRPELTWLCVLVAAMGHTLACMAGFALGYYAKRAMSREAEGRYGPILHKYGAPAMLLTGVPGVGDPFAVVAGWFRLPPWRCTAWCAAGKLGRFWLLGAGVTAL